MDEYLATTSHLEWPGRHGGVRLPRLRPAAMIRTSSELRALQGMPYALKVEYAEELIHKAFDWAKERELNPCVSVSGLDSTVTLHLVRRLYPGTGCLFVNTGMEYPEIIAHAKNLSAMIIKPQKRFHDVVRQYGYPVVSKKQCQYIHELRVTKSPYLRKLRMEGICKDGSYSPLARISAKWRFLAEVEGFKVSEKCCHWLKKEPIDRAAKAFRLLSITGVTAEESSSRATGWIKSGCNAFDGSRPSSRPIMVWTHQDVLRYAKENQVVIPSLYGEIITLPHGTLKTTGLQRTGCYGCGFGVHLEKGENRFQRLAVSHPKLHKYVITRCGMGPVLDAIKVPYLPSRQMDLKFMEVNPCL